MGDQASGAEQRPQGGALTLPPAIQNDGAELAHVHIGAAQRAEEQPALAGGEPASVVGQPAPEASPAAQIPELPTGRLEPNTPPAPRLVDRARAQTFGQALRILLQRRGLYVALTETYLLTQFHDRLRAVNGVGIQLASLRAYLCGEKLPDEAKARLIADALGAPRSLLLYVAGYLTPEDLAHYPGPQLTLATVEADIRELEALPLAAATKARIARDLRISARILCLLAPDRIGPTDDAPSAGYSTVPDERETLIEQLIDLWATPTPPAPLTPADDGALPTA